MKREADAGVLTNLKKTQRRVAEATGVSERSVRRIVKEIKTIESGASTSFATPHKERLVSSPKSMLDNFNECVIRRTVNEFYITDKQRPTLKKIHAKLVQSTGFTGSLSTLRKVLMRLGFRWTKTKNNRRILMECHNIRALRTSYLRSIAKYRSEGRPTVFMDEIYIHGSHSVPFSWSDDSISGLLAPVSKGQQLIIVHAGSNQGFIPNAYIRFKSHQTTGDYHSDMNYKNFEKWLTERLIPNLPPTQCFGNR
jgi:transposase